MHVEAQVQEQHSRHLKIKAATPKASSWFINSLSRNGVFSCKAAKRCWWSARTWTKSSLSQSNTMCSSSWITCQSHLSQICSSYGPRLLAFALRIPVSLCRAQWNPKMLVVSPHNSAGGMRFLWRYMIQTSPNINHLIT